MPVGGCSKMGTSSRWHHEQAPHLSQFLNALISTLTHWVDNQPTYPRMEDSLLQQLKKATCTYTREYKPACSLSLCGIPSAPAPPTAPKAMEHLMYHVCPCIEPFDVMVVPSSLFAAQHTTATVVPTPILSGAHHCHLDISTAPYSPTRKAPLPLCSTFDYLVLMRAP